MISNVEHLMIYLLAIRMSSLKNVQRFKKYPVPLFNLFGFVLLSCIISLYILDKLLNMYLYTLFIIFSLPLSLVF